MLETPGAVSDRRVRQTVAQTFPLAWLAIGSDCRACCEARRGCHPAKIRVGLVHSTPLVVRGWQARLPHRKVDAGRRRVHRGKGRRRRDGMSVTGAVPPAPKSPAFCAAARRRRLRRVARLGPQQRTAAEAVFNPGAADPPGAQRLAFSQRRRDHDPRRAACGERVSKQSAMTAHPSVNAPASWQHPAAPSARTKANLAQQCTLFLLAQSREGVDLCYGKHCRMRNSCQKMEANYPKQI